MSRRRRVIAQGVSFAFGDRAPLLENISLTIGHGFAGLVGANGAGKSTLLALLGGTLRPSAGTIRIEPADAIVRVCRQSVDRFDDAMRALAERNDRDAVRLRASLALDADAIEHFSTLSAGERQRWQIGAALLDEADVLLLDEPTNHLDGEARARVVSALRSFHGVGVVVSHDRVFLDEITAATIRVHNTHVDHIAIPYSRAREAWASEQRALEKKHIADRTRARAMSRSLERARVSHAAAERSGHTGARMKGPRDHDGRSAVAKGRAASAERTLGRKVATLAAAHERACAELATSHFEKEKGRAVSITGASRASRIAAFHGDVARANLHDVSVVVDRGDRIHLRGANGAGKTTLLNALLDACKIHADRIVYVPQEICATETARSLSALRVASPDERGRVLSFFASLGGLPERLLASRSPSPGEAKKLLLAHALARDVWLAIFDEPTNHLDLPSIERLEAALRDYPGALLLATHDEALARAVTITTWSIGGGRVTIE